MTTKQLFSVKIDTLNQLIRKSLARRHSSRKPYFWTEERMSNLLYQLQLIRLRVERMGVKFLGHGTRRRVMVTACWNFPIYSQTFVYQEITQLIRKGYNVRFLYHKLDSQEHLPQQFSSLWHARRKVIFHISVCNRSLAYFQKKMPEKVETLIGLLCQASGMAPDTLRSNQHFLQSLSFARMVEAFKPDYLHSYFFYEGTLFAFVASYLLNIPRGVSCYADHLLKDYDLKVVPLHLEQCKLVIATSERIKQELVGVVRQTDTDHIIVKPNAINVAQFPTVSRREPENGQPYKIICVSRIEPKKGLLYLVEAVRTLRDRNFNVELHIIGGVDASTSSETYARELEIRIAELKLGEVIHLEGRKSESDIKRLLAISHMFVAPFVEAENGDKDGIPTSLLEAMATGIPVIATDAGSILEVIDDGHDGVIVAQKDSNAITIAIADLINDHKRHELLGKNAARKIRAEFDVTVCESIFHNRLLKILDSEQKVS